MAVQARQKKEVFIVKKLRNVSLAAAMFPFWESGCCYEIISVELFRDLCEIFREINKKPVACLIST